MNSDDLDALRRALHGSDADPVEPDDFVTITESKVTRATYRHPPVALGDVPLAFDVIVTLANRIVLEASRSASSCRVASRSSGPAS